MRVGPLPRYCFPLASSAVRKREWDEPDQEWDYKDHGDITEAIESLGNTNHLLRKLIDAKILETTPVPDSKDQSCLFLTYRRNNKPIREQGLTFLSPYVRHTIEEWLKGRPIEEQQALFKYVGSGKLMEGLESTTGPLFHRLCTRKWVNEKKTGLDMWRFVKKKSKDDRSRYTVDTKEDPERLNIEVLDSHGLTAKDLTGQLRQNIFWYQKDVNVGLPLVDAVFLSEKDQKTYLFQLTMSDTHDIAREELEDLVDHIPEAYRDDVSWIMVNPREYKKQPSLKADMHQYEKWAKLKVRLYYAWADELS